MAVLYGRADDRVGLAHGALLEAVTAHFAGHDPAEIERLLGRHARVLAPFLPRLAGREPQARATGLRDLDQLRVAQAVDHAVRAAAGDRGALLVLDDLQWAPEPTMDVLDRLVDGPGAAPLAIVAIRRAGDQRARWQLLARRPDVVALELAPLSEREVRALAAGLRAPYGITTLRVTLNGRDVTSQLSRPDRRGRRTFRASASHGLRYGRNVVRVVRRDGPRARVRRGARSFTLTRARPLVGAGADRQVVVGTATRLNGRASRSRRAPKPARAAQAAQAGTPAGLSMRWQLIRKPQGSAATLEQPLRSFVQPADDLIKPTVNSGTQPARPLIQPDKPGTYVAALKVSDGVTSRTDTVTLTATAATPLVPIDTAASIGITGMAVGYHPDQQGNRPPQNPGEAFYPSEGAALQAVVLDRDPPRARRHLRPGGDGRGSHRDAVVARGARRRQARAAHRLAGRGLGRRQRRRSPRRAGPGGRSGRADRRGHAGCVRPAALGRHGVVRRRADLRRR